MFLIAGKIMSVDNLAKTAESLGLYMATVILGLVFHAVFTLSIIYFLICRQNPLRFFQGIFQAWITALATSSRYGTQCRLRIISSDDIMVFAFLTRFFDYFFFFNRMLLFHLKLRDNTILNYRTTYPDIINQYY